MGDWHLESTLKRGFSGPPQKLESPTCHGNLHVRDLHATMLHLLGIDHQRLNVPFQGLDARLTGVEKAHPIGAIMRS